MEDDEEYVIYPPIAVDETTVREETESDSEIESDSSDSEGSERHSHLHSHPCHSALPPCLCLRRWLATRRWLPE